MSGTEIQQKEASQYLTFILCEEEYGVHILKVRGIQGWQKPTPIPNVPGYVRGVINLRGEVVPIIDLRLRFGLEAEPPTPKTVVIIVRVEHDGVERTIGLVVDAVADVQSISQESLQDKPDLGGAEDNPFIAGLGMIGEKLVIVLDIDQLVDWSTLSARQKAAEQELLEAELPC